MTKTTSQTAELYQGPASQCPNCGALTPLDEAGGHLECCMAPENWYEFDPAFQCADGCAEWYATPEDAIACCRGRGAPQREKNPIFELFDAYWSLRTAFAPQPERREECEALEQLLLAAASDYPGPEWLTGTSIDAHITLVSEKVKALIQQMLPLLTARTSATTQQPPPSRGA